MGVRRWRGLVVLGAAMAVLAVACSSTDPSGTADVPDTTVAPSGGTAAGSTTPGRAAGATDEWTSAGLVAHSRLSSTKDSVVYAGVDAGELQVIALDPETGKQRWEHPSDVGSRVRGVELEIYTDDDTAYFLTRERSAGRVSYVPAQAGGGTPSFTAVETATGKERWSTPLDGDADPHAQLCGDRVCLFIDVDDVQQLWSFDRSTGEVLSQADVDLPQGRGNDALLASSDDDDLSTFIAASRGPVFVAQHSAAGTKLDWATPVDELFGGADVSPNGGWAGWSVDDGGWVVWLGTELDRSTVPKPGDSFSMGAVAGVTASGTSRWARPDRHVCGFALGPLPTLCDGFATMVTTSSGVAAPSVWEGFDLATGATTWSVTLGGVVDELEPGTTVLRLDDDTYVVSTPAGPTTVDLRTGPQAGGEPDPVGWCQGTSEHDAIDVDGEQDDYLRATAFFPCHLGGTAADVPPALPVPAFAGVQVRGYSVWVEDGTVRARVNP